MAGGAGDAGHGQGVGEITGCGEQQVCWLTSTRNHLIGDATCD